jgi:cytochrome c-type biogenesis protein CcmH
VPLFWFFIGMLTTVAIVCVLLPWLRTIPRFNSLPSLPWQAPLVGLLMIGASLGLYRWLGHPELLPPGAAAGAPDHVGGTSSPPAGNAGSMQAALTSLEGRLAKGGGSADDWELLAKSYEFMGRSEDAAKARVHQLAGAKSSPTDTAPAVATAALTPDTLKLLAKANTERSAKHFDAALKIYADLAARNQLNADGWADYADAAASARGGNIVGEPESYIAKALLIDPKHPKALWLKASADEEAGRLKAAVSDWQSLAALLPPDSDDAKIVAANLRRAKDAIAAGGDAAAGSVTAGSAVSGEVSLASNVRSKVPVGGTLFIVAKSVDSPGAPVAVFRSALDGWPVKFTLDDSQSMLPGRNLSSAGRVTIEARISQSGQAMPASGDLRGKSGIVNPADRQSLKIVIDEVIS